MPWRQVVGFLNSNKCIGSKACWNTSVNCHLKEKCHEQSRSRAARPLELVLSRPSSELTAKQCMGRGPRSGFVQVPRGSLEPMQGRGWLLYSLCFPLSFPSPSSLRSGFVVSWDSWVGVGVVGGVSWGSKGGGAQNPLGLLILQSLCSLCLKRNNAKGHICNLSEHGEEQLPQQHGHPFVRAPNCPGYSMCLDKHFPIWWSRMPVSQIQVVPRFIQQLLQRHLAGVYNKERRDPTLWGATGRAKPCSKDRGCLRNAASR